MADRLSSSILHAKWAIVFIRFFLFFFYFISFESFDKWKKNICKNVSQQELYIRIKFQIRNNFQPENSTGCLISISRNSEFGGVKRNKVNSACRPNRYLDQLQSYNETDGGKTRLEGSREEYHFPFFFTVTPLSSPLFFPLARIFCLCLV